MHVLYIGGSESVYSLYHAYLDSASSADFTLRWCATLAGAVSFLRDNAVDVALLDLAPPANESVGAVEQLHDCCPELSIVVITGDDDNLADSATLNRVQDHLTRSEITPPLLRRVLRYAYERKHVQERLRASEERYRLIVEDQAELICRFKPDYTLTFVNRAYSEQYQMRPEAMLGLNILDMIPEADRPSARAHINRLTPEHPQAISEHRSIQPDGSVRWMQWQDRAIFDHAGNLLEVQGVGRDITDRRQAEERLKQAEAALRSSNLLLERRVVERTAEMERAKKRAETILNSSRDAIILADGEQRIQQTNAAFERLFKCSNDDYFHVSLSDLVDDSSRSLLENALCRLHASAETPYLEVRARRRDGTVFDAEIGITPALFVGGQGDNGSIVCIMRDITERKRAERTLNAVLEEEREFQKYLKELHEVTMELTQVDDFNAFCQRTVVLGRERLGFERLALFLYDEKRKLALGTFGTDMQGNVVDERHVEFAPALSGVMVQSFERSERFCYVEDVSISTGSQLTDLKGWNAAAVVWNGKQRLGWLVADGAISQKLPSKALLDVLALYSMTVGTLLARKQAEAALRESEARLRLLFDNVPDGIVLKSLEGRFIDVNPTVTKWTGLTRDQIIGRLAADLDMFVPVAPAETASYLEQMTNDALKHTELTLRRTDGSIMSLDVLTHPIMVHGTSVVLSIAHDITPRKQAEDELRNALQHERELRDLKSRFISTTSHEFRTPLTTIQAAADTLEEFYDRMTEAERDKRFTNIRKQIEHMTALLTDVLTIERMEAEAQQVDLEPIALPEFLSVLLNEFRDTYPEHHLNCDYQTHHLTLHADRTLLRQIITNLLSNAAKYSPKGSTVYCGLKQYGNCARIEVRDEGIGIPESDQPHLFDPFFRAKNSNGIPGTGLGLSIARRAVEAHGGSLTYESKLGVGTRFIVELPIRPVRG